MPHSPGSIHRPPASSASLQSQAHPTVTHSVAALLLPRGLLKPHLRTDSLYSPNLSIAIDLPFTMAAQDAKVQLLTLPLEVRHKIFEHTLSDDANPKKLLRYWFEKKETNALIATHVANDPTGPAPQVAHHVDASEDDSDDEDEEEQEEQADEDAAEDEDEDGEADGNEELNEDDDDMDVDEQDEQNADGEANATATAPTQPAQPVPVVMAARKWRHITNFMRLTHRPPPMALFLACPQLNAEAKNWYYDVAVLRIAATGSFAHTSFFEEAFSQITEAAFSPMENIRKVEVTFVWDTTWIRADTTGCVEAIFPALLRQRAFFVLQILAQAPDLKEVVIHWHDSAQDGESAILRIDVLQPFDSLHATVKIVEHYITPETKPHHKSIAGKQRVEFESIVEGGLDRLF